MLKALGPVDKGELLDVIDRLEHFGIEADMDRDLVRVTFTNGRKLQSWRHLKIRGTFVLHMGRLLMARHWLGYIKSERQQI